MNVKQLTVRCLVCALLFTLAAAPALGEEQYAYVDFVTSSSMSYNATATVGQVFDEYAYFDSVTWKEYPHLDRMIVEATGIYNVGAALAALRDAALAESEDADLSFYSKSLNEFEQVSIVLYFSVDQDMTEVLTPSTSGLVRCRNGKNRTFQPGGAQVIFENQPPPIETLYRQCYN